jgi:GTP-binding protein
MILPDKGAQRSQPTADVLADRRALSALQPIRFLRSAAHFTDLPAQAMYEVAFAGRSNAGKSSAINAICQRRRLAFVSKEPGRTQLLNLFALDDTRYLVDLPGYGYARVPQQIKAGWDTLVGGYLAERSVLSAVFLMVDIRRGLGALDEQLLAWLRPRRIPVRVLLTKADKLSRGAASQVARLTEGRLRELEQPGSALAFSSVDQRGVAQARAQLCVWLQMVSDGREGPEKEECPGPRKQPRHEAEAPAQGGEAGRV